MKPLCMAIVVASCLAGRAETPVRAPTSQARRSFELKRRPVPEPKMARPPSGRGIRLVPTTQLPPGVSAAMGTKPLVGTGGDRSNVTAGGKHLQAMEGTITLGDEGGGRYLIVLARSSPEQKHCDRLYVDTNADGRFTPSESWDISRSVGAVDVEYDRDTYFRVFVHPIKLTQVRGDKKLDYWVGIEATHVTRPKGAPDSLYASYLSQTCVVGSVAFGDKTDLLAIHDVGCAGGFDRRVDLPRARPGDRRERVWAIPCQILLDVNGNGHFDVEYYAPLGPENRWLTRLVQRRGAYYELAVEPDGTSICITPVAPAVGTLAVPKAIVSADLVGPEFATTFSGEEGDLKLPVGRYSLYRYSWRSNRATLTVHDPAYSEAFELKPDQTSSLRAGPPLTMKLRTEPAGEARAGSAVEVELEVADCAGKGVSGISMLLGRPAAPKLKIVDPSGKTIVTGTFEYG